VRAPLSGHLYQAVSPPVFSPPPPGFHLRCEGGTSVRTSARAGCEEGRRGAARQALWGAVALLHSRRPAVYMGALALLQDFVRAAGPGDPVVRAALRLACPTVRWSPCRRAGRRRLPLTRSLDLSSSRSTRVCAQHTRVCLPRAQHARRACLTPPRALFLPRSRHAPLTPCRLVVSSCGSISW
jgi:hypothetical protein